MKKKVLTLGLAMSLVAAPFALAEEVEDTLDSTLVEQDVDEVEAVEVVENETVDPTEKLSEGEVAKEEGTEEVIAEEEATEEATEDEVTGEEVGVSVETTEEEATEEEVTEEVAEEGVKLTDLSQSWAQEEIQYLVDAEIISGFPDGTFQPTANMTRDQFAKVLALSLGLEENEAANPFTDAGWAAPYIGALVNAELTQGLTESLYGSKDNVTREQLAVFFVRTLGFEEEVKSLEIDELGFADRDQIAGYAQASVAFLTAIDFIKGIEKDGTFYFNPKGNADRQAVARLAYEFVVNGEEYQERAQALLDSLTAEEEVVEEEEEVVEEEEANDEEDAVATEEEVAEEVTEKEEVAEEQATEEEVAVQDENTEEKSEEE